MRKKKIGKLGTLLVINKVTRNAITP